MKTTTRPTGFKTPLARAFVHTLFGIVLLSGCSSGSDAPSTGAFVPVIVPPGGGGEIGSGSATAIRIGFQRNADYTLSAPRIALNDNNMALVAWQEDFSNNSSVWVNVLSSNRWDAALPVDSQDAIDPQVAVDPLGNAVVVWTKLTYDTGRSIIISNTVWARRYVGGVWQLPTRLSVAPVADFFAFAPAVTIDVNGNILVAWTQHATATTVHSIWTTRFSGSWSPPELRSDGTHTTYGARVATDDLGNFMLVWTQDTSLPGVAGPRPNLWAQRYSGAVGGAAEPIGYAVLATSDGAARPSLYMNASGSAVVVWEQTQGAQVSIAGNRYDAGMTSWGTAARIDTASTPASAPSVALDPTGNAMAVWLQSVGTTKHAWASRDTGSGWQPTPTRLVDTGSKRRVSVDMDGSGNALAVWEQNPTNMFNPTLRAQRYLQATMAWAGSASSLSLTGSDMALDVNGSGKALVVAKQKVSSPTGGALSAPWALLYQP